MGGAQGVKRQGGEPDASGTAPLKVLFLLLTSIAWRPEAETGVFWVTMRGTVTANATPPPPSRQVDVAWTIVRVTEEQASL
jgi:hypothetical protein